MRTLALAAGLLAAILGGPSVAGAQAEGSAPFSVAGTDAQAIDEFLDRLRAALSGNDRARVARMLAYPLAAWDGKRSVKIKTRQELLHGFDRIFDPTLRETIRKASAQTAWANWQGVMFDDGRIWLRPDPASGVLRIVTINPPVGAGEPARAR